MAVNELPQPTNLLLAREELQYVLGLLQVDTIPGLEVDPAGELGPEQQAVAMRVAERALRARELALLRDDGQFVLHNDLLSAIGTCAFSQSAIFVFHWVSGETLPTPAFVHSGDNGVVVHTRPADVLHLFTIWPKDVDLLQQLLELCAYVDTSVGMALEIQMTNQLLAQTREMAEITSSTQAFESLVKQGIDEDDAATLVSTLATRPHVSNLQFTRQVGDNLVRQDVVLLQSGSSTLLVSSDDASRNGGALDDDGRDMVTIRTVTRSNLLSLFAGWLTT